MMFDENQLVEIKCHPKTKSHYINKGYNYTKMGDSMLVKAKDLTDGSNVCVEVLCDFCGEPYYPSFYNHNHKSNKEFDACNNCRTLKSSCSTLEKRANEQFERVVEFCRQNDYILLTDKSEYKDGRTPITYECKKHGIKHSRFELMVTGRGCKECWYEEMAKRQTLQPNYVKEEIEKFNGNKLLNAEDYIGSTVRNLRILCGCGREYITSFNDYMSSDAKRCYMCTCRKSKGEFAICQFLENNSIVFMHQHKFEDCKDKLPLPFDFYLPEYNLIIEYNGKQHYEPVDYFGGQNGFIVQVEHDQIKNNYCENNDIDMLVIPYWDYNNIEKILIKQLNL